MYDGPLTADSLFAAIWSGAFADLVIGSGEVSVSQAVRSQRGRVIAAAKTRAPTLSERAGAWVVGALAAGWDWVFGGSVASIKGA